MRKILAQWGLAATCVVVSVVACKFNTARSGSKLRDAATKVSVSATVKVGVDRRLKISLASAAPAGKSPPTISDIRVAFPQSNNNNVDLTKAANGNILLTVASKVNISAKITSATLTNSDCQATEVGLSTSPVQATFSCNDTSGSINNNSGAIKKYPPSVTDPAVRKAFDQLAVECAKTPANIAVVDYADREIVYGCYCAKVDRQLIYQNFVDSADAFSSDCLGNLTTVDIPLTYQLDQACKAANTGIPAPVPAHGANGGESDKPSTSCACPTPTLAKQAVVIKFADIYGFYKPADVLAKKRIELCPK